ncbi:MAG: hypothetical protein K8R87_09190 [Verrucomicrobia bacterium]|nr:hypothetical protein [Verrucomicrobiota bacterium]
MTIDELKGERPIHSDPYALPGAPQLPPDPEVVTLRVYEFNEFHCTATDPESARRLFEEHCCEVVSAKDVVEVKGDALNHISHTFGVDIEPYEWWWSARIERNRRMRDGELEPQFLNPKIGLPPVKPDKRVVWTACANGEYSPPSGMLVWTSNGTRVRRGIWHAREPLSFTPEGWQAGDWRDRHGDPIEVSHWHPFDEFERVPAPPSSVV